MASVTGLILDSFQLYSTGTASRALLLSGGAYAELISTTQETCDAPSWDTSGQTALRVGVAAGSPGSGARRVFDTPRDEYMVRFRAGFEQLPAANGVQGLIDFRDNTNAAICSLVVNTTGTLSLRSGGVSGAVLGTTAGVVVRAGEWQFYEMYIKVDAAAGVFTLYGENPDVPLLALTALALGSADIAQYVVLRAGAGGSNSFGFGYMRDFFARKVDDVDTPVFIGDMAVATLYPNADTADAGWTAYPRKKLGTGILDTRAAGNAAVSAAQSVDFDLGSADYTLEGFVRFSVLPTGAGYAALWGKWVASGNLRSYQLIKCGPSLNAGALVFRISTDGTAGAVQNLIAWPWEPETDVWYFLTIERVSNETTLYIDGISKGAAVADANTYATVAAPFAVGAEMGGAASVLADTAVNGFHDELRVTVGVFRYDGDFTPPAAPFPTTLGGDPLFADVALLAGWDNGIVDSSLNARALTARNGALQNTPDDGVFAFQTINTVPIRDDTFIQAALRRAEGELIFATNPTATQTVVLGATTYTFRATVPSANDVLIGADAEESIENLIAAVDGDAGSGTIYGAGTVANATAFAEKRPGAVLDAFAITAGAAGNSIVSTTTVSSASWTGATLAGGEDIPGPSAFDIQRLPYDATEVFAAVITTRAAKTEAGTTKIAPTFVGPQGGETDGDEHTLSTTMVFYNDAFEADPDGGALTPSTIASAKIKYDRTE